MSQNLNTDLTENLSKPMSTSNNQFNQRRHEFSNHCTGKDVVPETDTAFVRQFNERINVQGRARTEIRKRIEDHKIAKDLGISVDDI